MARKKEAKPKLERSYNIPLRKSFRHTAKHKKTPKAVRAIKIFLAKHMKAEPDKIKLGMHLNEHAWKHGIKNPPHHVKVHVVKDDDGVKAELEGFEFKGAVKSEKKKEPTTMKDKLASKLGIKDDVKKEETKETAAGAKEKPKIEPEKEKVEKEEVKVEEKKEEVKPKEEKVEVKAIEKEEKTTESKKDSEPATELQKPEVATGTKTEEKK